MTTRRDFILGAAAVSAGCASSATKTQPPTGALAKVREPAVGQSWRYAKRDYFTNASVDTQMDRVTSIAKSIQIELRSETGKDPLLAYPSWSDRWWHDYMEPASRVGPPIEVQQPWGKIIVDPHWTEPQAFKTAIPLWPAELRPGWRTRVGTDYKIPSSTERMPWQLSMYAQKWEPITVPAGHFEALHYYNIIDFRFTEVSERTAALRQEDIWFVPSIGRWAARESRGIFREDVGFEIKESSYRWELLSWT